MNPTHRLSARVLSLVWLWTGVVSLIELSGQSTALLQGTLISDPAWQQAAIVAGALLDLALGVALWWWPQRRVYDVALAAMVLMTVVATLLSPALWLHPLGPLLKNLPIALILWQLRESSAS
ncbi:MAG: DoxX-like family protein [Aquabacterium sp.]|jgi:hypothetical protein|uniref:DoxX-like family protein n=1 Tax=Aquabacterium sp. TaxID=1872578 RepID=UPI002A36ADA4|nr:DoxX-like family protein [Aquabacterium sp.]MDX9844077.1 DoxX-like family protein [Aquabacterium sp.]